MKSRLAFDPGKKGGWALLDEKGKLVEWGRMPVTTERPASYNHWAISLLFEEWEPHQCVIEKVNAHAAPNASAAFSLGGCFEMLRCIATLRGCPVVYAVPNKWTKEMVSGPKKNDKAAHLADAARLFPEFLEDSRVKANDGVADAILMAEWARRNNL